ncbi:hypothetical protein LEP3755_11570 [Leptolyngbya sp. NIES-3755]|nr:hypothetical protein LEP3755_11570 [Leptolyngbya sp. NIES-3755]
MSIRKLMQSVGMRSAIASIIGGSLVASAIPARAAVLDDLLIRPGVDEADFDNCARDLTRGRVAAAVAADACAKAIRPKDLGICVTRITRNNISGDDALSVCRQVRRPVEAANCVTDIARRAPSTATVNVLDGCRRSLLPERFSRCVVDLSRELKLATDQSIANCIDATDRSRDLLPTVLPGSTTTPPITTPPAGSVTPTTPVSPGQSSPLPPATTPGTTRPGTVTPQRF